MTFIRGDSQRGASFTEAALTIALIAFIAVPSMRVLSDNINATMCGRKDGSASPGERSTGVTEALILGPTQAAGSVRYTSNGHCFNYNTLRTVW